MASQDRSINERGAIGGIKIPYSTQIGTWRALVQVSQVPCSGSKEVLSLGAPFPYIYPISYHSHLTSYPEDGNISFPRNVGNVLQQRQFPEGRNPGSHFRGSAQASH